MYRNILSLILCVFAFVDLIYANCKLNFWNDLTHMQPLLISNFEDVWFPLDGFSQDGVDVRRDETVRLVCPNTLMEIPSQNSFANFIKRNIILAKCREGKTFIVDGNPRAFESLQCLHQSRPSEQRTHQECAGKETELVNIGYPVGNGFVGVYEICFNKQEVATLWSKVEISPHTAKNRVTPLKSKAWTTNVALFKNINAVPAYTCEGQAASFKNILGKTFSTGNCCYDKGQLVADRDLTYGPQQSATYHFLNAIPHYSTCSRENWQEIENRVRRLAANLQRPLTVWTGQRRKVRGGGRLNIFHYDLYMHYGSDKDYGIPVPQFIWKVVYDPQTQHAVAIIQINQDVTLTDIDNLVLCRDICDNVDWLNFLSRKNIGKGYIYCCDIVDFEFGFGFKKDSPLPSPIRGVLRDTSNNKW